jgi:putative transposase
VEESAVASVIRYVERNPVRAGIVEQAEQYVWSSAAAHLGLRADSRALLDLDWWKQRWTTAQWEEVLRSGEQEAELAAIRRATYTGRPWGSLDFVADLEKRLQRRLTARVGGRPKKHTETDQLGLW